MKRKFAMFLLACLSLAVPALAQGRGGPPGGGGPGGGGMGGGGGRGGGMGGSPFPGGSSPNGSMPTGMPPQQPSVRRSQPAADNPVRVGLQLGPPGQRWWDDRGFVKNLKLRPDQQSRMDTIFEQNRGALLSHFENLQTGGDGDGATLQLLCAG